MLKRKILSTILIFTLSLTSNFVYGQIDISAKSALLMDYNTGEIIYSFEKDVKLPPASITKIMTLLIAIEEIENSKIKLMDEVRISEHAAKMIGTTVYLDHGEIQTVENLIKAISIRSANDAAVALAEHISGSENGFVDLMNKRAEELGMKNTSFKNASGLPSEGHYSTAYDISLMSRELMKHEMIMKYLRTYMEDIEVGKRKPSTQTLVNTNRIIKDYSGGNGIKTGYTGEAKHCISASAKRGDLQLIAVLLGSESSNIRFEDAKRLLDFGFSNYESVTTGKKNDVLGRILVEKGREDYLNLILKEDVNLLLPKGSLNNIQTNIILPESMAAPISKDMKIGELVIKVENREVIRVNLFPQREIEKARFFNVFSKTLKVFIKNP